MNAKITPFIFFLIVVFSIFNCKGDDQETPLEEFKLSINQDGNQLSHSWTEVNISDFEQYIIVRSKEPIPGNLDPFLSSIREINEVVHKTTLKESTEWNEIVLSEEPIFYYRVFIKLSDRYIASNEVKISFDEKIIVKETSTINGGVKAFHHPELKLVYIINVDTLFVYDYLSNELVAKTALSVLFYDGLFSYGKFNGQDEIYLVSHGGVNENEIIVLDANNLNFIETIYTGDGEKVKVINTEREGIIVIVKKGNSNLKVIDRADGSIITSTFCFCNVTYNKNLKFISETENTVRLFFSKTGEGAFFDYKFSDTWEFLGDVHHPYFESSGLPKIAFTSNKEYFIPNYNGTIYNREGVIINSVYDTLDNIGTAFSYIFKDDESAFFNINNHSLSPDFNDIRSIDKYTFPNVDLISSWELTNNLNSIEEYELFYDGETLLLSYSSSPYGLSQVMIFPIDL